MMGLERELKDAAATLERCNPAALSLRAGCALFLRFVTRTSCLEDGPDFGDAKAHLVARGAQFAATSVRARATIADLGARFVRPGAVGLTHGHSRVVLALLCRDFRIRWAPGAGRPPMRPQITAAANGPVSMILERR